MARHQRRRGRRDHPSVGDGEGFLLLVFRHSLQQRFVQLAVGFGLGLEFGQLVDQQAAAIVAVGDAVGSLELMDGIGGKVELAAEFGQAFLHPLARLACRIRLCLQLVLDVGLGDRIGDTSRLFRVERRERDLDDVGLTDSACCQCIDKGGDGVTVLFERRLRLRCPKLDVLCQI